MRAKKSERYAKLTEQVLGVDALSTDKPATRRPSVLEKRQATVEAAASGRMKTVKVFAHDPARIRPWHGHNRDYQLLTAERCADLIDGFRRAGQQFAAVVRPVKDSDKHDYEFICGARRHWTATYLKKELIIEVRDIDDRDAFLLQDLENRDREDISDYERACDYMRALPVYFGGKKSHMAEQLQIDQGNFSRFLALAELPKEVVNAYGDIRELLVHHGTIYSKLLKNDGSKKRLISAAKRLKGEGRKGKDVLAALRQSSVERGASVRAQSSPGKNVLDVKKNRVGEYTVTFKLPATNQKAALDQIRQNFNAIIDELKVTLDSVGTADRKKSTNSEAASTTA